MKTTPLDKTRHNRNRFDCGNKSLNNYLRLMANQQAGKNNSRTFVLEDDNNKNHIIGFYTLTMTAINLSALPEKLRTEKLQKKHQNTQAAGLIARLAVDKRYTKQGYGEWLLINALKKLLLASDTVAFPIIIVDAKDGVLAFYQKFGFNAFNSQPKKLFITLADIRATLE